MPVKIRVYATLRERVGWDTRLVELKEPSVSFSQLLSSVPDLERVIRDLGVESFIVLVNGHNIQLLEGLETKVKDGDVIDIFPQAAGGAQVSYV